MPELRFKRGMETARREGCWKSISGRDNSMGERLVECHSMASESSWVWLERGGWRKRVKGVWEEEEGRGSQLRVLRSQEASWAMHKEFKLDVKVMNGYRKNTDHF